MRTIRTEFYKRKREIDRYYGLITEIETGSDLFKDGAILPFETGLSPTLKSGAVLMLYNLIESSVSKCINLIHERISSENITFIELSDNIQKIWLKYHYKLLRESNVITDKNVNELRLIIEILTVSKFITLSQEDSNGLLKSLFSGNLDAKQIRKIAAKYGIVFTRESVQIRVVEQMRNQLAHGEISFEEASRYYSMDYMNILKDETIAFLEDFINAVDNYLTNKNYKK